MLTLLENSVVNILCVNWNQEIGASIKNSEVMGNGMWESGRFIVMLTPQYW